MPLSLDNGQSCNCALCIDAFCDFLRSGNSTGGYYCSAAECNHHLTWETKMPSQRPSTPVLDRVNYWHSRQQYINATDADQANAMLDEMKRCISLTEPDLEAVRQERWPGERKQYHLPQWVPRSPLFWTSMFLVMAANLGVAVTAMTLFLLIPAMAFFIIDVCRNG